MKLYSRASANSVIKAVMNKANGIGTSKIQTKQNSSIYGQNGHKVSSKYHSVKAAENMRTVSTQFINYLKENHGSKVVSNMNRETVKEFISVKSLEIKASSLNTYISTMAKVVDNLNELGVKTISREDIHNLRKELKNEGINLSNERINRATKNPEAIVRSMEKNTGYGLSARLQYEAGLRISDSTNSSKWKVNEDTKTLTISGSKDGITSQTTEISEQLMQRVQEAISNNYRVNNEEYGRVLKEAVIGENEKWRGSHSLRYNHAQELYNKLHEQNKDYGLNRSEQAILSEISRSLGHSRIEITHHYLHIN